MTKAHGWHRKVKGPADAIRQRKYDSPEHRGARRAFKLLVESGQAHCWRCGTRLLPGRWQVGHDDVAVDVIRGPECTSCNRKAAARKGARVANERRKAARQRAAFVRPRR